MAFRRRTAGYRARIRRKARHPSATAARAAWSEYLPSRRAPAFAASAASRRLRLLRLVSPPPRHASHWEALMGDMRSRLGEDASPYRAIRSAERGNGSEIGVSEKPRRYPVPRLCEAQKWLTVSGVSGDACAARKLACTDSAQVEGRRRAGPERNPPPAHGRRREAALQGDGRYPDQAMQAAFADGCSARDQRRLRGGGARRSPATQSRPCQRWRITRPPAERP